VRRVPVIEAIFLFISPQHFHLLFLGGRLFIQKAISRERAHSSNRKTNFAAGNGFLPFSILCSQPTFYHWLPALSNFSPPTPALLIDSRKSYSARLLSRRFYGYIPYSSFRPLSVSLAISGSLSAPYSDRVQIFSLERFPNSTTPDDILWRGFLRSH